MSLRATLLRIVLAALLPLLSFSALMVALLVGQQRSTFRQGASERTRALLTAVDTELKRSIASLEGLATSEHLQAEDIGSFYLEAGRVLGSRPEWTTINLALPSGEQLLNLLRPLGSSVEPVQERATFAEVLERRAPTIGNLFEDRLSNEHVFAVRVPVLKEGAVAFVLSALVRPASINGLLTPQGLPADWVGVVLDRDETIVARTIAADELVGRPASESLRRALSRASQGWFHGTTVEGWDVYTPFDRSSFSGWSVAIGIPAQEVEAPFRRSLAYLGAFGFVLVSFGLGLAWLLSRRCTHAISSLAEAATGIGLGAARLQEIDGALGASRISEIDELKGTLLDAGRLIERRSRERDQVEHSLRQAEVRLLDSDRRKDEFLAMLGHELRNPLGIISLAVQLLESRAEDAPAVLELRTMMKRQVTDMTRLIDDLLDVSRITQGRIQVAKRTCDFTAVVRETTADHRDAFERSGIALEVEIPDRPLWLSGDRTRLAQVVNNLLSNANKFTRRGASVLVRLEEAASGEEAVLTVKDAGVGMDHATLQRIFEPFVQADSTIDRSRGGLGLGLALVRGLVAVHGGQVSASSEGIGRGTTIVVRLPLQPATEPSIPTKSAPRPCRPIRVLVIEDNRAAVDAMRMFLEGQGHTVQVAHSGTEAIEKSRSFRPEAVLCDIGLPGASGYEVARALRAVRGEDLLLVAVTGYGQDADRARAKAAGFDRHLTKPVDLNELAAVMAGVHA